MKPETSKAPKPLAYLLLGLCGVVAVLVPSAMGILASAELSLLDLRLRSLDATSDAEPVARIDIDRRSIEELGPWPWSARTVAGMLEILRQCGARTTVLSALAPRGPLGAHADGGEPWQEDRAELADAIAHHGAVALPVGMHFRPGEPPEVLKDLKALLASEPALSVEGLAIRSGHPRAMIELYIRSARREAIDARVAELLSGPIEPDFTSVHAAIIQALPSYRLDDEVSLAREAYLTHRALRAVRRFGLEESQARSHPIAAGALVPPPLDWTRAARLCGFVGAEPDADGVVRRFRLLGSCGGRVYRHLMLAVAAHELAGGDAEAIPMADRRSVTLRCADGSGRSIPTDDEGRMLLRWNARSGATIPAVRVVDAWREQQRLERLRRSAETLRTRFLRLGKTPDDPEVQDLYWKWSNVQAQLEQTRRELSEARTRALRVEALQPSLTPDHQRIDTLAEQEDDLAGRARDLAETLVTRLRRPECLAWFLPAPRKPPADADQAAWDEYRKRLEDHEQASLLADDALLTLDGIPAEKRRLETDLARKLADLRSDVAGRICLIDLTDPRTAPTVATPLGERTPLADVHAAALRTLLGGRFLRAAHPAVATAVSLLLGALVAYLAAHRPPLQAACATGVLAAGYLAVNAAVIFTAMGLWLPMITPVAAMGAVLATVGAYRYFTEGRVRRKVRDLFEHRLSRAAIDRLGEDPMPPETTGQKRHATCLVSGLSGMGALGRQLGPHNTVRLMNSYFDMVCDIVRDEHGGYLSRMLPEGVVAHFNAPAEQDDHARRAVLSAVEYAEQIDQLNDAIRTNLARRQELTLQVGIATGEAMFGNLGSTDRPDYGGVGECVELAHRLRAANDFFHTRVLVAAPTLRQCDREEIIARPLGPVLLPGVRGAVHVWDVLCSSEGVRGDFPRAMADFARGVQLLSERRFAEALDLFQQVHEVIPADRPTSIFLELCTQCAQSPPSGRWDPACAIGDETVRLACPWAPSGAASPQAPSASASGQYAPSAQRPARLPYRQDSSSVA
jgi:class 3 adenylate cyclase